MEDVKNVSNNIYTSFKQNVFGPSNNEGGTKKRKRNTRRKRKVLKLNRKISKNMLRK
jgi:hypothetical protein